MDWMKEVQRCLFIRGLFGSGCPDPKLPTDTSDKTGQLMMIFIRFSLIVSAVLWMKQVLTVSTYIVYSLFMLWPVLLSAHNQRGCGASHNHDYLPF